LDDVVPILTIERHPFFWGLVDPEVSSDLPIALPFLLGIHPRYAVPRLVLTEEVREALDKVYAIGSMPSTPLGESTLARGRLNQTLDKLVALFNGDIRGRRLLELGSGNGEFLHELKKRGADVTGLEIGPQAKVATEKYGIRVINQLFKPGLLKEKFDAIYSYGCLEHIIELDEVFEASRECMYEDGLFFHSVPNSAPLFEAGNPGHLAHEHVNYFTPSNGLRLLEAQGFVSADFQPTPAGNEVMLWGRYKSSVRPTWPIESVTAEEQELRRSVELLNAKSARVNAALQELSASGQAVGFYAGGYEYSLVLPDGGIRYFDGDSYKHGKSWLSGLSAIEPPEALKSNPVDHLVICRPHYFDVIVEHLRSIGISGTTFWNIENLGGR
jgi:2-polyprenyl-3-methyl-5-hydroxy-6-metoxy-1,4-benzoquinol methylase